MLSLIINADDCNLTSSVTQAILDCYAKGGVSSTTWLINLPSKKKEVDAIRQSGIGVGLHLNVSLGAPISQAEDIPSLVTKEGLFKKRHAYEVDSPAQADLVKEYTKQIERFQKTFGCLPTHLDTHHQLHDYPVFMSALAEVAREKKLPVRRSVLMKSADFNRIYPGMITTQSLLGDLNAEAFWTAPALENALAGISGGAVEVMCHPGWVDAELQRLTSMTVPREKEYALFSSPDLKKILEKHNIKLIHYGQLSLI